MHHIFSQSMKRLNQMIRCLQYVQYLDMSLHGHCLCVIGPFCHVVIHLVRPIEHITTLTTHSHTQCYSYPKDHNSTKSVSTPQGSDHLTAVHIIHTHSILDVVTVSI